MRANLLTITYLLLPAIIICCCYGESNTRRTPQKEFDRKVFSVKQLNDQINDIKYNYHDVFASMSSLPDNMRLGVLYGIIGELGISTDFFNNNPNKKTPKEEETAPIPPQEDKPKEVINTQANSQQKQAPTNEDNGPDDTGKTCGEIETLTKQCIEMTRVLSDHKKEESLSEEIIDKLINTIIEKDRELAKKDRMIENLVKIIHEKDEFYQNLIISQQTHKEPERITKDETKATAEKEEENETSTVSQTASQGRTKLHFSLETDDEIKEDFVIKVLINPKNEQETISESKLEMISSENITQDEVAQNSSDVESTEPVLDETTQEIQENETLNDVPVEEEASFIEETPKEEEEDKEEEMNSDADSDSDNFEQESEINDTKEIMNNVDTEETNDEKEFVPEVKEEEEKVGTESDTKLDSGNETHYSENVIQDEMVQDPSEVESTVDNDDANTSDTSDSLKEEEEENKGNEESEVLIKEVEEEKEENEIISGANSDDFKSGNDNNAIKNNENDIDDTSDCAQSEVERNTESDIKEEESERVDDATIPPDTQNNPTEEIIATVKETTTKEEEEEEEEEDEEERASINFLREHREVVLTFFFVVIGGLLVVVLGFFAQALFAFIGASWRLHKFKTQKVIVKRPKKKENEQ